MGAGVARETEDEAARRQLRHVAEAAVSLVSTWVEAEDGMMYQNPVLRGDGWFVCFDDDDPPEMVVADHVRSKPWDLLTERGVPYKNMRENGHSMRMFGKRGFKPAQSWFFDLTGPIPVPDESDNKAENPQGEAVYYMFRRMPRGSRSARRHP